MCKAFLSLRAFKHSTPLRHCEPAQRLGAAIQIAGFTLLEILIAMFIFTITSIILTGTLHKILNNQARIEQRAQAFSKLQFSLLLLSRDISQAVRRPILDKDNSEQPAFWGTSSEMTFTHAGLSNPSYQLTRSTLERTRYLLKDNMLIRESWATLDQPPDTEPTQRILLKNVSQLQITYFDPQNHASDQWPAKNTAPTAPPHAVRIVVTTSLGNIEQTYLIPEQAIE